MSTHMTSPVGRDDAAAQLERILGSPGFARNERLSRFLRFLVARTSVGLLP